MTELEERLSAALEHAAGSAPAAAGLAAGARARAARRRRTRVAVVGGAVALAVVVPLVVLGGWGSPDRVPDVASEGTAVAVDPAVDPGIAPAIQPAPAGYRWESYRDVMLQVPDSWAYGSLASWCAGGGSVEPPVVDRAGGVSESIGCSPADGYGALLEPAPEASSDWPVAGQDNDTWPAGAFVGRRVIGGVMITVAAREASVAQDVLDSAGRIGAIDAYGCAVHRDDPVPAMEPGMMSVCRYDADGLLEQSELLDASDAADAEQALSSPEGLMMCAQDASDPEVVRMRSSVVDVEVHLGACARLTLTSRPDQPLPLTSDILYWALSPGWTGEASGLPLPPELRTLADPD